jgi:DNA-directed RNA polymerases I and III subunit RPAC1
MEFICEKGIGKSHAKWSPVCTAYYRLMPDISIKSEIRGNDAKELKKLCPMGVFDIEDLTAVVKDGPACSTCRECVRHEKFADKIQLGKRKDVFEFTVESVGIYSPQDIVLEAISKLKEKVVYWYEAASASPEEHASMQHQA